MNKIKIMFVCHGNICRSTMTEALFRHMVREKELSDGIQATLMLPMMISMNVVKY